MGRKIKCVITVVVLLSIFSGVCLTASATSEVTVQVKDVTASAGQTVTTELIMDGTFAAIQGALLYDTEALTLEKIEATGPLSQSMTLFNKDAATGKFLNGTFVSASTKNMVVSGAVLIFTFNAGSKANGTYSFSVEQLKIFDEKSEQLTVIPVGTTTVFEGSASPVPSDSGTGPVPSDSGTSPAPSDSGTGPVPSDSGPVPSDSGTSPTPSDSGTSPDPDDPDASSVSEDPDASPDSDDAGASSDSDDMGASSDSNNTDSNNSDNSGPVILPFIISAVVIVGIALAVFVIRKKRNANNKNQENGRTFK